MASKEYLLLRNEHHLHSEMSTSQGNDQSTTLSTNAGGNKLEDTYDYTNHLTDSTTAKSEGDLEEAQNTTECEDVDEDVSNGGYMMLLPEDLIVKHIFCYLGVEHYCICAQVSVTWRNFTRTEQVYEEICKRSYLKQSRRKTLHVSKFGSYRAMLERRPRVKTGRGIYVLKFSRIRKIQRDMWTEVPVGAILETIYYRYLSFEEDGNAVFYALTAKPPNEMIPQFVIARQRSYNAGEVDHDQPTKHGIVRGAYQVSGKKVLVKVTHPWHCVQMEMNLLEDGCEGSIGKFAAMDMVKHLSSESGNFDEYWSQDLVEYKVPVEPFRFVPDARL